jgi:hypothetical protein
MGCEAIGFRITDPVELIRMGQFKLKHIHCATGMIGGRYSYEFTPTTIGPFIIIKCTTCREESNITNVDVM